jgi:hypothetical protein
MGTFSAAKRAGRPVLPKWNGRDALPSTALGEFTRKMAFEFGRERMQTRTRKEQVAGQ